MNRGLGLGIILGLLLSGCGRGEVDPLPSYGKGKIYETRQATNALTATTWRSQTPNSDGNEEIFVFFKNGAGRHKLTNVENSADIQNEQMWWELHGDILALRFGEKLGEVQRTETLRFRSDKGISVMVFLSRDSSDEMIFEPASVRPSPTPTPTPDPTPTASPAPANLRSTL